MTGIERGDGRHGSADDDPAAGAPDSPTAGTERGLQAEGTGTGRAGSDVMPVVDQPEPGDATATWWAATVPRAIRWWTWPLVVTALFLVLQPLIGSGWALFNDSYRYARQAEMVLGETYETANQAALDAWCETTSGMRTWHGTWTPIVQSDADHAARTARCLAAHRGVQDVTTTDPRYQSIFLTRPGYPYLAAPFIGALGIVDGMRLLGYVIACAGGILVYAIGRLWRLRATAAALGQAVYLICPLGWWALQGLGEGLVSICVLGAVAGIGLARVGRVRTGLVCAAASYLALGFTRYSTLLLVAAGLAVACAAIALTVGRTRNPHDGRAASDITPPPGPTAGLAAGRRPTWAMAVLGAVAALATVVAMPVLGLPGSSVTLQDTFTNHFATPLVPNPWYRLAALNYHFWPQWLGAPSQSWAVLGCGLLGLAALAVWRRDLAWVALALAVVGWAHIAAHPLPGEAARLGLLMWMPTVLGAAAALHAVTARVRATVAVSVRSGTRTDARHGADHR